MNKLRVGLLGLVLVCVGLVVKAQDVNWQVRGGGDCATIIGGVTNIDTQFGYHLGGTADIALREDGVLRIQPSLLFSQKGWTFDGYYGSEQILEAKYSTRLHYLELPVPLAVRLRIGKECFVTFKFGPYVAYGLNAKTTMEVMNTDAKETFKANHFSKSCDFYGNAYDKEKRHVDYPKLNRWDVGVAEGIDPGPHRPRTAKGIDEHRPPAFLLLVLELIDVHQDGLGVTGDEFDGGPVGLGHDFRLLPRLRVHGQGRKENCAENQ